jgi:hypothetical protein
MQAANRIAILKEKVSDGCGGVLHRVGQTVGEGEAVEGGDVRTHGSCMKPPADAAKDRC